MYDQTLVWLDILQGLGDNPRKELVTIAMQEPCLRLERARQMDGRTAFSGFEDSPYNVLLHLGQLLLLQPHLPYVMECLHIGVITFVSELEGSTLLMIPPYKFCVALSYCTECNARFLLSERPTVF